MNSGFDSAERDGANGKPAGFRLRQDSMDRAASAVSVISEQCVNPHHVLPPDRWCVSPQQFYDFVDEMTLLYPGEDPSIYTIVDDILKPRTASHNCSFALMCNSEGLMVKHFVTHTW